MPLSPEEAKILSSIVIGSENNPKKPEFPADDPKFPATPTYKINVPGFENVWLKDESKNPTGTHKDRLAWEIVVTYHYFLLAKKRGQLQGPLPQFSIISSGSAAIAIQSQMKKYNLPNLKVLCDNDLDKQIVDSMKKIGCEVYFTDLSAKELNEKDILELTKNQHGFDITSADALDPTTRYYDWLSYEILNSSPDYCFIPFGTGVLYENVLNINRKEVTTRNHDLRFQGHESILRKCNFFGVTTDDKNSKAHKLYSPHLPFAHFSEQWIRIYRYAGFCGPLSDVQVVKEEFLDKALEIAKQNDIDCEPSGIAGLGLLLQMQDDVPRDAKILIVNTGKVIYP